MLSDYLTARSAELVSKEEPRDPGEGCSRESGEQDARDRIYWAKPSKKAEHDRDVGRDNKDHGKERAAKTGSSRARGHVLRARVATQARWKRIGTTSPNGQEEPCKCWRRH